MLNQTVMAVSRLLHSAAVSPRNTELTAQMAAAPVCSVLQSDNLGRLPSARPPAWPPSLWGTCQLRSSQATWQVQGRPASCAPA